MKQQKFILKSKTVWSALFTLFVAITPEIQHGLEHGINSVRWWKIAAITFTTTGTVLSRYVARGELYTPYGFLGRDYVSPSRQDVESQEY